MPPPSLNVDALRTVSSAPPPTFYAPLTPLLTPIPNDNNNDRNETTPLLSTRTRPPPDADYTDDGSEDETIRRRYAFAILLAVFIICAASIWPLFLPESRQDQWQEVTVAAGEQRLIPVDGRVFAAVNIQVDSVLGGGDPVDNGLKVEFFDSNWIMPELSVKRTIQRHIDNVTFSHLGEESKFSALRFDLKHPTWDNSPATVQWNFTKPVTVRMIRSQNAFDMWRKGLMPPFNTQFRFVFGRKEGQLIMDSIPSDIYHVVFDSGVVDSHPYYVQGSYSVNATTWGYSHHPSEATGYCRGYPCHFPLPGYSPPGAGHALLITAPETSVIGGSGNGTLDPEADDGTLPQRSVRLRILSILREPDSWLVLHPILAILGLSLGVVGALLLVAILCGVTGFLCARLWPYDDLAPSDVEEEEEELLPVYEAGSDPPSYWDLMRRGSLRALGGGVVRYGAAGAGERSLLSGNVEDDNQDASVEVERAWEPDE